MIMAMFDTILKPLVSTLTNLVNYPYFFDKNLFLGVEKLPVNFQKLRQHQSDLGGLSDTKIIMESPPRTEKWANQSLIIFPFFLHMGVGM